jgi:hypothetical protein
MRDCSARKSLERDCGEDAEADIHSCPLTVAMTLVGASVFDVVG